MGFVFDFDKFRKNESRYNVDYEDEEFDYEYSEEFFYDDEYDIDDLL
ncbi:MAG: hypothetical protein IJ025_01995 [Clostridia bacterium]|nr:hypothetical protein [Clostridia bacterium]